MHIRKAKLPDIPSIVKLYEAGIGESFDADYFANVLSDPLIRLFVMEDGKNFIGFMHFQVMPPEADLLNIAVVSGQQRKGIGREGLKWAEEWLITKGVTALFLEVRTGSGAAQFYEKLGFQRISVRPAYYSDGTDADRLQKNLV